ncbi:hypothetical protein, partial [Helicobacter pylori]|uniref:hypothetical protein n=1 Tax=Helicobacter pylori TaxID=210 RepID=UPI00165AB4D7
FHSIQGPIQGDLEQCKAGSAGVITNNTWGSGCAFVKETLNSLLGLRKKTAIMPLSMALN